MIPLYSEMSTHQAIWPNGCIRNLGQRVNLSKTRKPMALNKAAIKAEVMQQMEGRVIAMPAPSGHNNDGCSIHPFEKRAIRLVRVCLNRGVKQFKHRLTAAGMRWSRPGADVCLSFGLPPYPARSALGFGCFMHP
jgi:hypothetical protein